MLKSEEYGSHTIEVTVAETGYIVQVRRTNDEDKVIWRCSISFETATIMPADYGRAIERMIDFAKYNLDQGFIK